MSYATSSAVSIIDGPMLAKIATGPGRVSNYAHYLALNAGAGGDTIDSRQRAADALGVTVRTISRWRKFLDGIGFLMRYAGGHKGLCTRMVVKRFGNDQSAFVAKRAMAACWLATRDRIAALAIARRKGQGRGQPQRPTLGDPASLSSLLPKGDMNSTRLTSLGGEQGAKSAPLHSFIQGELLGICGQCEFPEANARHRKTKTRTAWTNTRTSA